MRNETKDDQMKVMYEKVDKIFKENLTKLKDTLTQLKPLAEGEVADQSLIKLISSLC